MQLAGAILTVIGGAILFLVIACVENPRATAGWFVIGGSILLWILLLRGICTRINDSDMSDSSQTVLKIIVICVGMIVGIFLFAKLCNDGVDNIVTGGLLKNEAEIEQFKSEIRKVYGNIPDEDLNLLWSSYDSPIFTSKKLRPTTKECYEFLFTLKLRELKELSDAELEERLGYAFRVIPLSSYLTSLDAKTEREQCAQMFVLKRRGYSITPLGCFLMVYRPGIREHNYPKTFQKYMDEHPEYKGVTSCGAQDPTIISQLRDFYTSIPINELSRLVTMAVKQRSVIEAEAAAEVAKIQAQADLEVTKIQADAAEYAGQKEAAKNKAISESLTPDLIDYYYIQQWSGELPSSYVGSENVSTIVGVD